MSLAERLTERFYYWEQRGRGDLLFPITVEPEPPFLYPHQVFAGVAEDAPDDGRKGFFQWLFGASPRQRKQEERQVSFQEPRPHPFDPVGPPVSFLIAPAANAKTPMAQATLCLQGLASCRAPVTFELVGKHRAVAVQLVAHAGDEHNLRQSMLAHFPEVGISEGEDITAEAWPIDPDEDQYHGLVLEFCLEQEFMRPLRAFTSLEPDPLTGIYGVLDGLSPGEYGLFQVIFTPTRAPWAQAIMQGVTLPDGTPFFMNDPTMVPLAKEKVSSPLFAAVVRIAAKARSHERTLSIIRALSGNLSVFERTGSNGLQANVREHLTEELHLEVAWRLSKRTGMLLNAQELVGLVHPPSASVRAEHLIRHIRKTKPAPAVATGHRLELGINEYRGQQTPVSMNTEARLRHMHVIGATGSGKSNFLLNLITQDVEQGNGLAVLDPHGDLIDRIIERIPESRHPDVVLFDPADEEWPIGFNILQAHTDLERTLLASDLVAVFQRLSTSWGDQMHALLGNAILAIMESTKGGTLVDLRQFLVDKDFRKAYLATVRDEQVVSYWEYEFPALVGKPQVPILTRLNTFLRPKIVRNIVAQRQGLDMAGVLDKRRILLMKLSQGLIGAENSLLLGTLLVTKIHQAALSRQSRARDDRQPFYLYIDEFQNFITPSLSELLSGVRKYGLGLILAHQDMRQIAERDRQVAGAVLSNPGTRVCFRIGDADAKQLASGFAAFEEPDFLNLGTGQAIVRIGRAQDDCNLDVPMLADVPKNVVRSRHQSVRDLSRRTYATHRPVGAEEVTATAEDMPSPSPPAPRAEPVEQPKTTAAPMVSTEEALFLEAVETLPNFFVSELYEALWLSAYKGNKFKETFLAKGFITQEETRDGSQGRVAKRLRITQQGQAIVRAATIPGKGGVRHKRLQHLLKERAEKAGWIATIEEQLSGTVEAVDLGLRRKALRVAVEISMTTKTGHEAGNVRKAIAGGYTHVLCVSESKEHLDRLSRQVEQEFGADARVSFTTPEGVEAMLSDLVSGSKET